MGGGGPPIRGPEIADQAACFFVGADRPQHEMVAFLEVDAAEADGVVAVGKADGLLEDIGVQRVIRPGGPARGCSTSSTAHSSVRKS